MPLHSALDQCSLRHVHSTVALIVAALFVVTPRAALAQLSDVKGSKDHPMVSRYAGSVIIGYDFRKFDDTPFGASRCGGRERTDSETRNSSRATETGGRRHAVTGRAERR